MSDWAKIVHVPSGTVFDLTRKNDVHALLLLIVSCSSNPTVFAQRSPLSHADEPFTTKERLQQFASNLERWLRH
jgi:hypothetical protein